MCPVRREGNPSLNRAARGSTFCLAFAGDLRGIVLGFGVFCLLCSDAADGTWLQACNAADSVTVRQGKQIIQIRGQVVENPSAQSLLLMTSDAQLHEFKLQDVLDRKTDPSPFQYDNQTAVTRLLQQEMGPEYRFKHSAHYTVCYNTSAEFAHWCVGLLERLHCLIMRYQF